MSTALAGDTLPVEDPSTGEAITEVARGTARDVDAAVAAAAEELAGLESLHTGKPGSLARGEIAGCVGFAAFERVLVRTMLLGPVSDGHIAVPQRPGLLVDPDPARLTRHLATYGA